MLPIQVLKFVDLTHALAGPVCTYHHALLGAEVIKIENPRGGDDCRHFAKTAFDAVNGGKKSVILDLKKPEAISVIRRLLEGADVLVDNFKPGTAQRYGLNWDAIHS